MKKHLRVTALILAVVLCFGAVAGIANPAHAAAATMKSYMLDLPRGSVSNTAWGQPALNLMGGWHKPARDRYWSVFFKDWYDGQVVYCIEPGIHVDIGDTFSRRDETFWDNYPSQYNPTISPTVIKAFLGRVMQYGWHGNGNRNWSMSNATHQNEMAALIATQLIVWEVIVGERDASFNKVDATQYGKSNVLSLVKSNHPLRAKILASYNDIVSKVQQHVVLPSFFARSTGSAKTIELEWDGEKYSYTLKDENKVLANYKFSSDTTGIDFSVEGNELTISCSEAPSDPVLITADKVNSQRSGVIVWTDGRTFGGNQDFCEYGASVSDPVMGFLNVDVTKGTLHIKKTAEDDAVEGITFTVSNADESVQVTTNADGEASVNLAPGTYTVTEQTIDRYVPQSVQEVTIISAKTTEASFNNELARGKLEVVKTAEDGIVQGMMFHLFGTSTSGIGVDAYAVTDENGIAVFEDVLIGSFTLEETETPDRYVVPPCVTVNVRYDETTKTSVHNTLKKFNVVVQKQDAETKTPQSDASLAGAKYGIYKGETLIDTYTTDQNGTFTTAYYVCGDDWTIREISSSEGYLLDDTIYEIDMDTKTYMVEKNGIHMTVKEDIIKGSISIIKHSDNGDTQIETPEEGAVFEVYLKSAGSYDAAKEAERDKLFCDEHGYAQTKDLPYGMYTVHQVSGQEGRNLIEDFDVYICEDGEVYRFLINNALFASHIKIVKKDAETSSVVPCAGAGFMIYTPEGEKVQMRVSYPKVEYLDVFYTDEDGMLITPEPLDYGKGYSLLEVQAPYGYVRSEDPVYFDVNREVSGEENGVTVIEVAYYNMPQKGVISISKTGEVFQSVSETGGVYTPIYEVQGLQGAVYKVTAREDIYTPDGTLRTQKGTVVAEITTNADGAAKTEPLYLGSYLVEEVKAPAGMLKNDVVYEAELVYAGQDVEIMLLETGFYNERQHAEISLSKTLEQDEMFHLGMNDEITEVLFGIYAAEGLQANDGSVIPKDGLVQLVPVNENGDAVFTVDLPFGSYYIREYAANAAYVVNDEKYPVVFSYAGDEISLVKLAVNKGAAIANKLVRGSIEGLKINLETEPLAEAVIGLFRLGETEFSRATALKTAITTENGVFKFTDVPYGSYIVRELEAPEGYVLNEESIPVTIADTGQIVAIELVNRHIVGSVQLTKVDADYPENKLSGAVFAVYRDHDADGKLDRKDEFVGAMEELSDGIYRMDGLVYGDYLLIETEAPEGFVLDKMMHAFRIRNHGETTVVETQAGIGLLNLAQKGNLIIKKTSDDDVKAGFTFVVEGADFSGIPYRAEFVTNEKGYIEIHGLRIGTYVVYEAATKETERYILPPAQTVTIEADKTETLKFHNEHKPVVPDIPKTGDQTRIPLWSGLSFVLLFGGVLCGVSLLCEWSEKQEETNTQKYRNETDQKDSD